MKGEGELPTGYRYTVASGSGGRTQTRMVELHVDDSDHFDSFRAAIPFGGSFSVRWAQRPYSPPSAPPANLPHPAADTVATSAPEVEVGAGEAEAATGPPILSPPAVRALKVGEAREACTERGLVTTGLKADLAARLLAHEALRRQMAAGGIPADVKDDGSGTAETYDLKNIHAMRLLNGALEYEVRAHLLVCMYDIITI